MAQWLSEKDAAAKIERCTRVLRSNVKKGTWNVQFRTLNGRSYQYNEKDLDKIFTVHKSA